MRRFDPKSLAVIIVGAIMAMLWFQFLAVFSYRCPDGRSIIVTHHRENAPKICIKLKKEKEAEALDDRHE